MCDEFSSVPENMTITKVCIYILYNNAHAFLC